MAKKKRDESGDRNKLPDSPTISVRTNDRGEKEYRVNGGEWQPVSPPTLQVPRLDPVVRDEHMKAIYDTPFRQAQTASSQYHDYQPGQLKPISGHADQRLLIEGLERQLRGVIDIDEAFHILLRMHERAGHDVSLDTLRFFAHHCSLMYATHKTKVKQLIRADRGRIALELERIIERHESNTDDDGNEVIFTGNLEPFVRNLREGDSP